LAELYIRTSHLLFKMEEAIEQEDTTTGRAIIFRGAVVWERRVGSARFSLYYSQWVVGSRLFLMPKWLLYDCFIILYACMSRVGCFSRLYLHICLSRAWAWVVV